MAPANPPVAVYKDPDGWVWRWVCRTCCRSDWSNRHRDALNDANQHIRTHRDFGFKR